MTIKLSPCTGLTCCVPECPPAEPVVFDPSAIPVDGFSEQTRSYSDWSITINQFGFVRSLAATCSAGSCSVDMVLDNATQDGVILLTAGQESCEYSVPQGASPLWEFIFQEEDDTTAVGKRKARTAIVVDDAVVAEICDDDIWDGTPQPTPTEVTIRGEGGSDGWTIGPASILWAEAGNNQCPPIDPCTATCFCDIKYPQPWYEKIVIADLQPRYDFAWSSNLDRQCGFEVEVPKAIGMLGLDQFNGTYLLEFGEVGNDCLNLEGCDRLPPVPPDKITVIYNCGIEYRDSVGTILCTNPVQWALQISKTGFDDLGPPFDDFPTSLNLDLGFTNDILVYEGWTANLRAFPDANFFLPQPNCTTLLIEDVPPKNTTYLMTTPGGQAITGDFTLEYTQLP